jgi:CRISPR-associated protein Csm5
VREAARSAEYPYLPGSSLKGALRTALLYNYLSNHADVAQIERIVKKQLADPKVRRESFAKPLEEAVFFCDYFDGARNKTRSGEAQMDLMRVVSLSDARWVGTNNYQPEVAKINIYLVEKIRHPQRRDEVSFVSGRQRQATYAEVIPAGSELSAELHVDGRYLQHLAHWLGNNDGLKRGDDRYWIGAASRLEKLFGISLEEARTLKPEAIEEKIGMHLLACYDRFSRRQLERQGVWLDHYLRHDSGDANNFAARIQNGFAPVVGAAQPLLHLGYGAGFTATTVLLYFLEDRRHDNLVKAILEKFQIGKAPNQPPPYTANIARFPKSRRLVESENRIQPLGWIALLKAGEAPPDVNATATAVFASGSAATESAKPVEPEYFKGTLNPKKPPMLDAVVLKSGRPNRVLVYLEPERRVELDLNGYASPLDEKTVIVVRSVINNKGELVQVSFSKRKS